jgi:hypothetical protein
LIAEAINNTIIAFSQAMNGCTMTLFCFNWKRLIHR